MSAESVPENSSTDVISDNVNNNGQEAGHLKVSTHQRDASEYSTTSFLEIYKTPSEESKSIKSYVRVSREDLGSETIDAGVDDKPKEELDERPETQSNWSNHIRKITESNQKELRDSNFDTYGFSKAWNDSRVSKESYDSWYAEYLTYVLQRKKKWQVLMKNNGLNVDSDIDFITRFPPKSMKVKKMVRKGIPSEWRGNAWFFYAGGYERLNKHVGVYDKIIRDTKGIKNKDTEVIERDLHRTFPDNVYFNEKLREESSEQFVKNIKKSESLIDPLRRVLIAFAHYQPHIGYCQSLNFLAGLLLLFMSEERTFWMLVILTERILPNVHAATLEGVHTDQGVLMLCIKEYIPQLWSILGKTFEGETVSDDRLLVRLPPVTLVTSSWFMSVFVGILPIEVVLRIWDILWYEGSKTIFRLALTLCRMCLDDPSFYETKGRDGVTEIEQIELFQFMQRHPKTILDPNLVIDNCFKKIGGYGYGSLSQIEINKCREFVKKQRSKLDSKKNSQITAEMTDEERRALTTGSSVDDGNEIHDIYDFHKPIMKGMVWNKSISDKMKRKFTRKSRSHLSN